MTPDRSEVIARIKALPPLQQQARKDAWWVRLWCLLVWKQVQS